MPTPDANTTPTTENANNTTQPTTTVDNSEVNNLRSQNEELKAELIIANKLPELKKAFKQNGGNKKSWNDFFKLNKDALLKTNDANNFIKEIKTEKPYFFKELTENQKKDFDTKAALEKDADKLETKDRKEQKKEWLGTSLHKRTKI